jgi:hypothetical protein
MPAIERLCGSRHLVHVDPGPEWLARESAQAGLAPFGRLGAPPVGTTDMGPEAERDSLTAARAAYGLAAA